uniref:Carbamoyl phosphate synthase small chain n=1 Tax=Gelidium vagum TaxID=35171 RepID=A0A141SE62_GELVA|nr:carbamoyl-phosphate synthase arginine-specific small subunit [Gelidium vagum]AMK96580.1 carbamoyl-phosphate synthase arginine-specific small subunit [Gelidium vagum]
MIQNLYQSTLLLKNGQKYQGWSFSNNFTICGEVVFNTGMTGYQEIMTDTSYSDQIIIFTYPEIGNYGINIEDYESSSIQIKGIIAKNICINPYNWRNNISLYQYLIQNNIPHIFGIDTRKLTKNIRHNGVMQGCISSELFQIRLLQEQIKQNIAIEKQDKIIEATTYKGYKIWINKNYIAYFSYLNQITNNPSYKSLHYRIVIIDFGVKSNIISRLLKYECEVFVIPANSSYNFILHHQPDGILLSNGPGDPSKIDYAIKTIQQIIENTNIPLFGICMGHQIISLALGFNTFKLKFGHRGLNHPAGNKQISEITSQNHGFAVQLEENYQHNIKITHLNLNDYTIAGLLHKKKPIFSVQYHPEASPGPHDSDYLFKSFLQMIQLTRKEGNYSILHPKQDD